MNENKQTESVKIETVKGFCKGFQTGEEMTWEVDTAPESILCFPNPAETQGEGGE